MDLERLEWISEIEKTRHLLLLAEKRREKQSQKATLTKKKIVPLIDCNDEEDQYLYLIQKCAALFTRKIYCSVQRKLSLTDSMQLENGIGNASLPAESRNDSPVSYHRANSSSVIKNDMSHFTPNKVKLLPSFTVPDLTKVPSDLSLLDNHNIDPYHLEINPIFFECTVIFESALSLQLSTKKHGTQLYGKMYPNFLLITTSALDSTPQALFSRAQIKVKYDRKQTSLTQITFGYRSETFVLRFQKQEILTDWLKMLTCNLNSECNSRAQSFDSK